MTVSWPDVPSQLRRFDEAFRTHVAHVRALVLMADVVLERHLVRETLLRVRRRWAMLVGVTIVWVLGVLTITFSLLFNNCGKRVCDDTNIQRCDSWLKWGCSWNQKLINKCGVTINSEQDNCTDKRRSNCTSNDCYSLRLEMYVGITMNTKTKAIEHHPRFHVLTKYNNGLIITSCLPGNQRTCNKDAGANERSRCVAWAGKSQRKCFRTPCTLNWGFANLSEQAFVAHALLWCAWVEVRRIKSK